MELPFYLRILPTEALEVLAYYRRRGSSMAYADAMIAATGLSERGFGKAIRRLVTKGYLVLDGDQRYRLTEHGQRAVGDLPGEMAQPVNDDALPEDVADEVERVPLGEGDDFDALFDPDDSADLDSLFDDPIEVEVDIETSLNIEVSPDEATLSDLLDDAEDEDDLFAALDADEEAAFDDLFGGADDEDAAQSLHADNADVVNEVPAVPDAQAMPDWLAEPDTDDDPTLVDLFAGMDDSAASNVSQPTPEVAGDAAATATGEVEIDEQDEPADGDATATTAARTHSDQYEAATVSETSDQTSDGSDILTMLETFAEQEQDALEAAPDDLFEWLEIDQETVSDSEPDTWGELDFVASAEPTEAGDDAVYTAASTTEPIQPLRRRLVVALPQPLVAGQPAHVTIGLLPDDSGAIHEPQSLLVRLSVVNGEPSRPTEMPLLLTNGLTRQDVTITPGFYNRVRLRVRVFQMRDAATEAVLCGGMYVDADVVANGGSAAPVAFGADVQFQVAL